MITTSDLICRLGAISREFEAVAQADDDCVEDLESAATIREAISEILRLRESARKTGPLGHVSYLGTPLTQLGEPTPPRGSHPGGAGG